MSKISEGASAQDIVAAAMGAAHGLEEGAQIKGTFTFDFYESQEALDRGDAPIRTEFSNVVATVGKNLALDTYLAGSAYTVVGPFLGLISSTSFSAVSASDTMSSHAGWLEAGNANAPTYTSPRKTAAWASASGGSKALSAALSFTFTGSGTVQGAFLVFGTGAVSTIDSTAGTLYSAGTFSSAQPVISGNILNCSYTASL